MRSPEIAYLGPHGTYSHLVAEKRFGRDANLVDFPNITEICAFVAGHPSRRAIVPIENSSGGAIYETVDILLGGRPRVHIDEELSLEVRLALLGRPGVKCRIVYSHFAPLEHSDKWLRRHMPNVERREVASTAKAAMQAALETNAAALGSRRLARIYGLKILKYPVEADIPNVTVFLAISGRKTDLPGKRKTTLAVKLPNIPGALCTFLEAFRDQDINLSRLISRPIRGCPRQYAFLVDAEGGTGDAALKRALRKARKSSEEIRVVGSFPCRRAYTS